MAYDASQDQESNNQNQQNQANQSAGSQPTQTLSGGGAGFAGSSASPGTSSATGAQPQTPYNGGWTNLNSYLTANADQSSQLGQSIANNVQGQAQQAQGDLNTVQQGFQNQSPFQQLNNTTSNQVDQAFVNPSQYAPTSNNGVTTLPDTTQAQTYLNNSWGITPATSDITAYSPSSGKTWADVGSEYQNAGSALQNTQTESGRDTLLQNQYGSNGNQYNSGEQNFDQLLLQQNPNNQESLNSIYQKYNPGFAANPNSNGIASDLSNATQAANNYATNETNRAAGFQTQAHNDLTNDIQSLGKSVSGELSTDKNNFINNWNNLEGGLSNTFVQAPQAQQLGLSSQYTYGINPNQFLHEGNNVYATPQGANYAASGQDWQNFAGLNNLLSGEANGATDQQQLASIGLTGTQAQQALAPAVNPYTFDAGGYQAAMQNNQNQYNAAATPLENQIATLQQQLQYASHPVQNAVDNAVGSFSNNNDNNSTAASDLQAQLTAQQAALKQLQDQYGISSGFTNNGAHSR
jgi:hypothetical protein